MPMAGWEGVRRVDLFEIALARRYDRLFATFVSAWLLLAVAYGDAAAASGNDYQKWDASAKLFYVIGVLEGWASIDEALKGTKSTEPPALGELQLSVVRCMSTKGMTMGQAEAIVNKYIADNPAEWHNRMAYLVLRAMLNACR
jgi:hypothetical protein